MRSSVFTVDLFADPAWDMLLDLYRAELDQHRVSVTSLCLASGVPNSTALRWLKALEDEGLISRRQDPLDGRRSFVALTVRALEKIEVYFAAVGEAVPLWPDCPTAEAGIASAGSAAVLARAQLLRARRGHPPSRGL